MILNSYWLYYPIHVAVRLGVADPLKDGIKSIEDLSVLTQTDAKSLYRLLRALSSIGIFAEIKVGSRSSFRITPMAQYLRQDSGSSVYDMILYASYHAFRLPWENLIYSIKTGKNAFEKVNGMCLFDYLQKNHLAANIFHWAMAGEQLNEALVSMFVLLINLRWVLLHTNNHRVFANYHAHTDRTAL